MELGLGNQGRVEAVTEEMHPADEIALAISRANGILAAISNLYDSNNSEFATSAAFISESVKAASQILAKANLSLDDFYSNYSLQRLDDQNLVVSLPLHQSPLPPIREQEGLQPNSDVAKLTDKLDTILSTLPVSRPPVLKPQPLSQVEQQARTYDEFLNKLTTMSDIASSNNGSKDSMLPLLESLRADMKRFRSTG